MNIVEELAKLQQLKSEGALTEEEFTQAKRKLLEEDTPEATPPVTPTVNVNLTDGLNELMDEDSSLGNAANRYVDYKYKSAVIGAVLFVIVLIVMAIIFSNASSSFKRDFDNFHQDSTWQFHH